MEREAFEEMVLAYLRPVSGNEEDIELDWGNIKGITDEDETRARDRCLALAQDMLEGMPESHEYGIPFWKEAGSILGLSDSGNPVEGFSQVRANEILSAFLERERVDESVGMGMNP